MVIIDQSQRADYWLVWTLDLLYYAVQVHHVFSVLEEWQVTELNINAAPCRYVKACLYNVVNDYGHSRKSKLVKPIYELANNISSRFYHGPLSIVKGF